MEKRLDYVIVWGISRDIDTAIDILGEKIFSKAENGYRLLGGASIAVNNGYFIVAQTLTKEVVKDEIHT